MDTGQLLTQETLSLPLNLSGDISTTLNHYVGALNPHPSWLVLYFYPKDSTPGCTTEGLDFNRLLPEFHKLGAQVLGVSRDTVSSHDNFITRQEFKFSLISDTSEALCKAFDVIKEKNMYGRKSLGIERSTFLISPEGRISAGWRKVKVADHAQQVLDTLKAQQAT